MTRGIKSEPDPILEAMRDAAADERKAVEFFEARRWGEAPACPRCGSVGVYAMKDATTGERNKDFRWRCRTKGGCGRMFTVRTNTVLEESRLPLRMWVHAFWSACSSKKGVSALRIKRECGMNYKTALYLMHRVREAMSNGDAPRPKMTGAVEVDDAGSNAAPRTLPTPPRDAPS